MKKKTTVYNDIIMLNSWKYDYTAVCIGNCHALLSRSPCRWHIVRAARHTSSVIIICDYLFIQLSSCVFFFFTLLKMHSFGRENEITSSHTSNAIRWACAWVKCNAKLDYISIYICIALYNIIISSTQVTT